MNVNITNNTTFTLIKNLPFNTSDYNDALVVVEDHFKSNLLLSKADMLNYITYTYHIIDKENDLDYISKIKNICVLIILTLLIILLFISIYYYIVLINQPFCAVETVIEVTCEKPNRCVFGAFCELFKLKNSSYEYYPSRFLPNNIKYNQN